MNSRGNVIMIGTIFVAIALVVLTFIIAIFMSHINSVLYSIKLDMYSMNKSAIIAVNKNITNTDNFSYSKEAYKEEFLKLLKHNYELNDNFSNDKKLITHIDVEEYDVYRKNKKDTFTKKRSSNRVIHTVLKVKVRPIILKEFLENIFVFTVHEDVNLNMVTEY